MQITMELLLTRLTHEHPDLVILNRGRQGIVEEIRLLPDQPEPLSLLQDTLYVTEHIQPELLTGFHKKTYILCFGPEEEVPEHCSDMTVLRTDRELADLFNAVIKCFHDYMDWQSRIDSVIYRDHDFQDLIDISEDLLDFPMMVFDPSLKLLAYSKKSLGLNDNIFQKAVQTGYLYAKRYGYEYAIQVDGDGQHDASFLGTMADYMREHNIGMLIGSRFIEKQGFQSSALRQFGIRYFTLLIKILTGKKITDPTSGMRMVGRDIIEYFAEEYPKDYPEPETAVTIVKKGWKVEEIPVVMKERQGGVSSISPKRSIYYMIKVSLACIIAAISA